MYGEKQEHAYLSCFARNKGDWLLPYLHRPGSNNLILSTFHASFVLTAQCFLTCRVSLQHSSLLIERLVAIALGTLRMRSRCPIALALSLYSSHFVNGIKHHLSSRRLKRSPDCQSPYYRKLKMMSHTLGMWNISSSIDPSGLDKAYQRSTPEYNDGKLESSFPVNKTRYPRQSSGNGYSSVDSDLRTLRL